MIAAAVVAAAVVVAAAMVVVEAHTYTRIHTMVEDGRFYKKRGRAAPFVARPRRRRAGVGERSGG